MVAQEGEIMINLEQKQTYGGSGLIHSFCVLLQRIHSFFLLTLVLYNALCCIG